MDSGTLSDTPVYYDSKDLVTHGVCIGMTGSGKTGLCVALLEECARSGVPVLIVDPKGDLANLKLLFSGLTAEEFEPWVSQDAADAKGVSRSEYAAQQANLWKNGLADWGLGSEDIRELQEKVDITIFTPGSSAGVPLDVLRSMDAPENIDGLDDELIRDEVAGIVSALLGLLGQSNISSQDREHILISTVLEQRWRGHQPTTLTDLISLIQNPPFKTLGALDLESFFPENDRRKLAFGLNALLASPSFQSWLQGEPLSVDTLLKHPGSGKPRLSICSIAHLSDAERMFFVSLLLNQFITWMRRQPGTSQLRALLYFDEIAGYLPPHPANPPSKQLFMTLLKQGRAFGTAAMLVTQNPVDLDYKALSNCGTWLLGKLQTDQDKARILDGLQGASSEAGKSLDRRALDALLSQLRQRVFLLHNVHSNAPKVMHSRWAMSYLAGPMTRDQLRGFRQAPAIESAPDDTGSLEDFIGGDGNEEFLNVAPALPRGLTSLFAQDGGNTLEPWLFFRANVTYRDRAGGPVTSIFWTKILAVNESTRAFRWSQSSVLDSGVVLRDLAPAGCKFRQLPAPLQDVDALKQLGQSISDHIIAAHAMEVVEIPGLKLRASVAENVEEFAARLKEAGVLWKRERAEKLEATHLIAVRKLEEGISKAEEAVARDAEKVATYRNQERVSTLSSIGSAIFSVLSGRKATGMRKVGTTFQTASNRRAITQRAAVAARKTEQSLDRLRQDLADKGTEHEAAVAGLENELQSLLTGEIKVRISAMKSNIRPEAFGVAWLPEGLSQNVA